jgi:hypothetical protein
MMGSGKKMLWGIIFHFVNINLKAVFAGCQPVYFMEL